MKCATDSDSINETFVRLAKYNPVTFAQGADIAITIFSRENVFW